MGAVLVEGVQAFDKDQVEAYLTRIRYEGPRDASAETLRLVHRAHAYAVPFENLDVHLGRPLVLDAAKDF